MHVQMHTSLATLAYKNINQMKHFAYNFKLLTNSFTTKADKYLYELMNLQTRFITKLNLYFVAFGEYNMICLRTVTRICVYTGVLFAQYNID